jgi:signal transduction histidine kinase
MHGRRPVAVWPATALQLTLLAAFVLAVYGGVVGVGRLVLGVDDDGNAPLVLPAAATVLVALALDPLRARLQPWTRRLCQQDPDSPYEVLARFAGQVDGVHALEEVAPRMAHVLAAGTQARSAQVWVVVEAEMRLAAAWPTGSSGDDRLLLDDDGALVADPGLDEGELAVPVRQGPTVLGALLVRSAPGGFLTSVERRLVTDLAAQAALVLRNVALTAALREQLDRSRSRSAELTASRRRLLETQDRERQRLERDIHDGAQQHLVALIVNLRLLKALVGGSPEQAGVLLPRLRLAVEKAEATLRDLASGVYPTSLVEEGVAAALRDAVGSAPLPIAVSGGADRWPDEVEAAIYFCCLEAVQNAVKHAEAGSITIRLETRGGRARFVVSDDGAGFDAAAVRSSPGMAGLHDRMEVLGGSVDVRSAPGRGCTVEGSVPLPAAARTAAAA